ncbi:2-phospho-L-lactate guanylyltransferase [Phenylobacterium sp.]|jgi:2-phospho-L-lactate guanylyltransferase|uniref:2-phospho-L-lactate guanylyltransferase n=1 Tax=Phenylobacterium sp. TaxID=1871053 RepID=UPI002F41B8BB
MAEVLIAVRGGRDAKSRCCEFVDAQDRAAFVEAMLTDMLRAIARAGAITAVHVVTPTPEIADLARRFGANALLETRAAGVNAAFHVGRRHVAARDPGAAVVLLPGDLPGLEPAELDAVAARHAPGRIVMVRAAQDGGTGALAFEARVDLPLAYGPQSFERHLALARAAGLQPLIAEAPSLAHDLDRPGDLRAWLAHRPNGATAQLMSRLAAPTGTAA